MRDLTHLIPSGGTYLTKVDLAYGVLREAILSGNLQPGLGINPKLIAEQLNMSFIPVREALRRLEQDGLVVIRPHVGSTVYEFKVDEIRETMLIRSELEALATQLAAPNLDADTLTQLEALVARMDDCIERSAPEEFGRLNREFHLTIYRSSPYRKLYNLIEGLWDQIPRARSVFTLVPERMRESQRGHHELMGALRARDSEAAAAVVRKQKMGALKTLLTLASDAKADTDSA
jgi:DNA-binding GntR family transcriptional regulator